MLLQIALGLSSSPSSLKGKTALRHCVELLYTHDVCILNMTETHDIGNANQGNWSSNFKIEKSFLTSLELTVPTANCTTFFFFPTLTSYTRTEICLVYHEVYACHSTCSTWKNHQIMPLQGKQILQSNFKVKCLQLTWNTKQKLEWPSHTSFIVLNENELVVQRKILEVCNMLFSLTCWRKSTSVQN